MVSVIVPYDKDRGYLEICLRSIREQKGAEFEIIEVNNPLPVAVNFNIGLRQAKGEFLKVVGEDDWLPNDSLYNLVQGIGDAPWVVANAFDVEENSYQIYKPDTLDFKENVIRNRIHGGGVMYRTEVLREIGGMNETLWTGEEYDMHLKLMSKGYFPVYIDRAVYFYRKHPKQKYRILNKKNRQLRADEIRRIQSLYSHKV